MTKIKTLTSNNKEYQPLDLSQVIEDFSRIHDFLHKMPNSKLKHQILYNYVRYYDFLSKVIDPSVLPFEVYDFDWQTIQEKYSDDYSHLSKQLIDTQDEISVLLSDIRKINESNGITNHIELEDYLNPTLGYDLIQSFFSSLPVNFQKTYQSILNGNLHLTSAYNNSYAYDLDFISIPKAIIPTDLSDYTTYWGLVHEIGHCYHYHLLNGRKTWPSLDDEVPSIFLEILFQTFTYKYLGEENHGINSLFNRQTYFASHLSLAEIFLNRSDDIIMDDDDMECFLNPRALEEKDYQRLLKTKYKKQLIEGKQIKVKRPLINYKYILSNIIAITLAEIYQQDNKEGLKILRDILSLPPNVSFKEKLDMFDLTGDAYQKTLKKVSDYGIKKHVLTKTNL